MHTTIYTSRHTSRHGSRHGTTFRRLRLALSIGTAIVVTALILPAVLAATGSIPGLGRAPDPPVGGDGGGPGKPPPARTAQDEDAAPAPTWTPPAPPGAKERVDDRERMVRGQIERSGDLRTAVKDPAVLAAMRAVPRHLFVPAALRRRAYDDTPLPIGEGQTISQPYMVAYMTETLGLEPGEKVLEIGTGSGYQAAVLGQMTPDVYTIEIIEPLAKRAGKVLQEQGYEHVRTRRADGYFGWEEHAPFDAIIVTAAAGHVPPPLWDQLKPGGRMVIPIGGVYEVQRLILLEKTEAGARRSRSLMAVRFVPFTRGEE